MISPADLAKTIYFHLLFHCHFVCHGIRNDKSINENFTTCVVSSCLYITAVCLLFLIKLKWPWNKSVYDYVFTPYEFLFCTTLFISIRTQHRGVGHCPGTGLETSLLGCALALTDALMTHNY